VPKTAPIVASMLVYVERIELECIAQRIILLGLEPVSSVIKKSRLRWFDVLMLIGL